MCNKYKEIGLGSGVVFFALCCMLLCTIPVSGYAQSDVNPDRNKPLEITAEETLEWHRNEFFFQAKKNVRAVQGVTTLYCNNLVAKYRDSKKSNIDIYNIEANGKVRIVSADSKAYGQKAVYDIDKGSAVMTGNNLKLVTEDQTVMAKDKFVYWAAQGRLEAIGQAEAVREGDRIQADKLIATFSEGENGKRVLETFEADGNVVITTQQEILTGAHAYYRAQTNVAELTDNVRIMRGESFLEGARAQVNLTTNISKIFGSDQVQTDGADPQSGEGESVSDGNGRVRAVFFPKSVKEAQ